MGLVAMSSSVRESLQRLMDAAQARYGALAIGGEEYVLVRREDIELILGWWGEKDNES